MNRREFFGLVGASAAAFFILPTATTYERFWKIYHPIVRPKLIVSPSDCSQLRTILATQTPVYDELFLKDWSPLQLSDWMKVGDIYQRA